MLEVYIVSLIVGGIFVMLSTLGGSHSSSDSGAEGLGADADAELNVDADAELDGGAEVDAHADLGAAAHASGGGSHDLAVVDKGPLRERRPKVWLPFFSFRFWTFFATFFGLTGTLLAGLSSASWLFALLSSLGVGVASGVGVAYTLHRLSTQPTDHGIKIGELVGSRARVTLPIDRKFKGKIEVEHSTQVLELVASTDEEEPLRKGDLVVIISFEGDLAQVVRESSLL